MAYYPSSQVKTNQYTNGSGRDIHTLSTTGELYIGYFYEISNGDRYTGRTPNSPNPIKLLFSSEEEDDTNGENLPPSLIIFGGNPVYSNQISTSTRSIPIQYQPQPTEKDYKVGEFQRYFCKKTNELRYKEIDKTTYELLLNQDDTIAWDLYEPSTIAWDLKGDKYQVYNTNKNMVELIETRNKWVGFSQFFKNRYLKYYLAS